MSRKIVTELIADPTKFSSGVRQAEASAAGFGGAMEKVGLKTKGATGLLGGYGGALGGLVTPQTIVAAGAIAIVGGLAAAGQAANEEEANIGHLTAALKANVPAWQQNSTLIESQISKSENLAFADDELRDSLASLVGVTHDVNAAFRVQSSAMNLARGAHVSLEAATDALVKAQQGNFKSLKSLGVDLRTVTDAQSALNQVDKQYAGQADTYAASVQGRADVIKIRTKDLEEDLGKNVNQLEAVFLDMGASAGAVFDGLQDNLKSLVGSMTRAEYEAYLWDKAQGTAVETLKASVDWTQKAADRMLVFSDHTDIAKTSLKQLMSEVNRKASTKSDLAQAQLDALGFKKELAELGKEYRAGKIPADEYRLRVDILKGSIADAGGAAVESAIDLTKLGDIKGKKYLEDWLKRQTKNVYALGTAADEVAASVTALVTNRPKKQPAKNPNARASGGRVNAGEPYLVGERGPEPFIPDSSGTIVSNSAYMAAMRGHGGSGRGGVTVNIYGDTYGIDDLNSKIAAGLRLAV